jgi:two-component system, NarL family, sensor histidine kinase BarA
MSYHGSTADKLHLLNLMVFGQSSFRRILLSRLLLLSVPVLLVGVYFTYRKARSAFLETARQNLTESAVSKGEGVERSIQALKTTLMMASDNTIFQENSPQKHQVFIERLAKSLPSKIKCVKVINLQTQKSDAGTCNESIPAEFDLDLLSRNKNVENFDAQDIQNTDVKVFLPKQSTTPETLPPKIYQLELLFAVPIYDRQGRARYLLYVRSALLEQRKVESGLLTGYPVVITQKGQILAHPVRKYIDLNIQSMPDAERLSSLLRSVIAGNENFLHLFYFDDRASELIAGYSSIDSPLYGEGREKWAIVAVAPINAALEPVRDIRQVLNWMIIALLTTCLLVTIYLSRELALPLEKLRDYVLRKDHLGKGELFSTDFKIKEFKQLAMAINDMVVRLESWGEEILSAWREAKTANQLKNEFLATTSHELRTPLNAIVGCIRIVKDGYCDNSEEELEFLQQADDAAIHLLGIINDVLDISKIEAGKLSVSIEKVDLMALIDEVAELQNFAIQKKKLQLKITKYPEKIIVDADPAKFKQVLINVLGNAIKFTEQGGIFIEVKTRKGQAIVTVRDTGIGIDPEQQDKLFRPFVMIDASTTRKFGGTGLGLAISRNLMELMRGSIVLFSPGQDRGSTVEMMLPLTESTRSQEDLVERTQSKVPNK